VYRKRPNEEWWCKEKLAVKNWIFSLSTHSLTLATATQSFLPEIWSVSSLDLFLLSRCMRDPFLPPKNFWTRTTQAVKDKFAKLATELLPPCNQATALDGNLFTPTSQTFLHTPSHLHSLILNARSSSCQASPLICKQKQRLVSAMIDWNLWW
jgi:hypothetical protein